MASKQGIERLTARAVQTAKADMQNLPFDPAQKAMDAEEATPPQSDAETPED